MSPEAVRAEFAAAGAWQEGHFILSSGLHSGLYLQCARALMDPARADRLCRALADRIRGALADAGERPTLCVSPAMGGVVVGHATGRQLGLPAIFTERVGGVFRFRRGFAVAPGTTCLVVEDVVTTGGSVRECVAACRNAGGRVALAAALVDRSGGGADTGAPLVSLLRLAAPQYRPEALPAALAALPPVSPGSRRLAG